jgi:hypothetical protein
MVDNLRTIFYGSILKVARPSTTPHARAPFGLLARSTGLEQLTATG